MRIPHLLILPLLVSVCVAQPLPGNIQKDRKKYYRCMETEPLAAPPRRMKELFPRPIVYQQLPPGRVVSAIAMFRQVTSSVTPG